MNSIKSIIVGISGASGAVFGIRLLEGLRVAGAETHLVISKWGAFTIGQETDYSVDSVRALASFVYDEDDMAAAISSGSFPIDAMAVVPCSMKTLAGIANGFSDDLILRAADVCLKERRPLILAVRETPLSKVHIENMLKATEAGAICMPPVPAFYTRPETIDDIVRQTVCRIMEKLDVDTGEDMKRWGGRQKRQKGTYLMSDSGHKVRPLLSPFSYGEAPYDIHLELKKAGEDILAFVTGGTRPHIGAVALAEPAGASHPVTGALRHETSSFVSPYISLLSAQGHKDAVLAEMFAKGLCEKYGVNVCAIAGVHVDNADKEEIDLMLKNAEALLALALAAS